MSSLDRTSSRIDGAESASESEESSLRLSRLSRLSVTGTYLPPPTLLRSPSLPIFHISCLTLLWGLPRASLTSFGPAGSPSVRRHPSTSCLSRVLRYSSASRRSSRWRWWSPTRGQAHSPPLCPSP